MIEFGPDLGKPLLLSLAFTVVGLLLFVFSLWVIEKLTPFSVRKEIEEDQNVAMGIIVGSLILGIALILAASLVDVSVSIGGGP
jgi:putative membrane protein